MKQILVYENWLRTAPTRIGTLFVEGARGKEVCSFEYDNEWLKHFSSFMLDPDLSLFKGRQFVPVGKELFGIFEDSCPDRWGRTLMDRRESIIARSESRKPRKLMESDYLLGVHDMSRMGALRFKANEDGPFLSDDSNMAAPPWVALRKLNDAVAAFESDTTHSDKWLQMLIAPGSSLGGARPKANVIAPDGSLWIAKFPSKNDKINCGAWEKTVYELAEMCGLNVSESRLEKLSRYGSTFLVKRFDRESGRRIHFTSAMALLGHTDGDEDCGYTEIASFIKCIQHSRIQHRRPLAQPRFSLVRKRVDAFAPVRRKSESLWGIPFAEHFRQRFHTIIGTRPGCLRTLRITCGKGKGNHYRNAKNRQSKLA